MPTRMVTCSNKPCIGRVKVITPRGVKAEADTRCGHPNCPVTPKAARSFGQPKQKGGKGGKKK